MKGEKQGKTAELFTAALSAVLLPQLAAVLILAGVTTTWTLHLKFILNHGLNEQDEEDNSIEKEVVVKDLGGGGDSGL